ncbi:hypothetical protein Mgra_00005921 [Meloidogyne graminicola]|uniref:ADP-ribosylation factor-related protein 1 n=1 Tax=Meloidogyne graminicola TaxID=189291 RepID=A0A8S9ZN84_9BILA|nr:hypothetical protein Mgra_00005921 [Meloidogyne graminicola]
MVKQQQSSSFSYKYESYSSAILSSLKDNQIFIPAIVTLIVLVITSLVFFFYRRVIKTKANTILIIGPSGSGKSTIFGKLVNQKNEWSTHSSVQENIYSDYLCKEGLNKTFNLVDFPGADTFRKALFNKWFNEQLSSVCCIIFVVDSATFSKKDVAEYLYDVLYEIKNTKIPILVVCNKQDLSHAKAGQYFFALNVCNDKMDGLVKKIKENQRVNTLFFVNAYICKLWTCIISLPLFVSDSSFTFKSKLNLMINQFMALEFDVSTVAGMKDLALARISIIKKFYTIMLENKMGLQGRLPKEFLEIDI